MSVSKTLAQLLALPANRSCADCRVTLVDSSQVYASYTPVDLTEMASISSSPIRGSPHVDDLIQNHDLFAPPGSKPSLSLDCDSECLESVVDPALFVSDKGLAHGVFVCAMCGAAHKLLQPGIAQVYSVKDPIAWNPKNVDQLVHTGNSHSWKVLEAYVPAHWSKRWRPRSSTRIAERLVFVRAKYEALAFCLPPAIGPLVKDAWDRILQRRQAWKELFGAYTTSLSELELHSDNLPAGWSLDDSFATPSILQQNSTIAAASDLHSSTSNSRSNLLPNRLVDFFCVVTAGERLDPKFKREYTQSLEHKQSVDEFLLLPTVTDCYPNPNSYSDMEFPEHVGSFVYPEGCRPSSAALSPQFFHFVLTCADGSRLYGGALKLYDDKTLDLNGLKQILRRSGYTGKIPPWFDAVGETQGMLSSVKSVHSDIAYLPKCLVLLSHYPFFDLWRKFLLQIYRIALVEAPLPIERFIANFVSEVPLPPPGKIEVRFGFTASQIWTIQRPPDNELPMCDFPFQPLFSTLSVSSVMVVIGCLLQETRVALVSKHYALLTPVAEALLSFLFPLHWHCIYIPILPVSMLDILDAPMPFLVGLHSRYLRDTPPEKRPVGVVFVDLDQDEIHLGWSDEKEPSHRESRRTPSLPERDAARLKARLAECASAAYILPDSGKAARITHGNNKPLPFNERDSYSHINSSEIPTRSVRRKEVFGDVDRAYCEIEIHLSPNDFLSSQGVFHEKERVNAQESSNNRMTLRRLLGSPNPMNFGVEVGMSECAPALARSHLLEPRDVKGFSVGEIRNAFFGFVVGLLVGSHDFIDQDEGFRSEDFLRSLHLSPRSHGYMQNVVATQMFERFIQERIENPNDPVVTFIDVAMDAKRTALRKTPFKIMKRGSNGALFSDGKSKQVLEKFTPPPPSHLGLPDDGRTYHYGSFPNLDPALFGKVRAPIVWPESQPKDLRTLHSTSDKLRKQQSFVAGFLGMAPRKASHTVTGSFQRAPNALERALVALSRPFFVVESESKTASDSSTPPSFGSSNGLRRAKISIQRIVTMPSGSPSIGFNNGSKWSKISVQNSLTIPTVPSDVSEEPTSFDAEKILFHARRKACILIKIFMSLQKKSRRYLEQRLLVSRIPEYSITSGDDAIKNDLTSRPEPSVWANKPEGGGLENTGPLHVDIKTVMPLQVMEDLVAVKLQALVRGYIGRKKHGIMMVGILLLQAVARSRLVSFAYRLLITCIAKVQARVRGNRTRKYMRVVIGDRLVQYRRLMFILWKRSRTSLAYRTKFWTLLKKASFLRHNLAVFELERLWKELQLPKNTKLPSGMVDGLSKLSSSLGLSNDTYNACMNLQQLLEKDCEEDLSQVCSFDSSSISPKSTSPCSTSDHGDSRLQGHACLILSSERTQIYERLSQFSSIVGEKEMIRLYDKFKIRANEKKRKKALAKVVWSSLDRVEESTAIMYELFPELKYSDHFEFVEASLKGTRRIQFDFMHFEFDSKLMAQKLFEERIRKNVSTVASLALSVVPRVLEALGPQKDPFSDRRRRASTIARGFKKWPECRSFLMKRLARNDLVGSVKPYKRNYVFQGWGKGLFDVDASIITLDAFERSLVEHKWREPNVGLPDVSKLYVAPDDSTDALERIITSYSNSPLREPLTVFVTNSFGDGNQQPAETGISYHSPNPDPCFPLKHANL